MFSTHGLTDMTDAWAFSLHPGIDYCLKCGHIISALSTIKALEPIHLLVLSHEPRKYATHRTVSSEGYCIIVGNLSQALVFTQMKMVLSEVQRADRRRKACE